MTKPTQAQIEAAEADQLRDILKDRENEITRLQNKVTALTAAAEVGPSETTLIHTVADAIENAALARLEEATIERCAQVADRMADELERDVPGSQMEVVMLRKAAAAIRARKDKP